MYKLTALFIIAILGLTHADTSLGGCPAVDPLPGFHMNKMLGYWYAIQKTDIGTPCISYNITRNEEYPEKYKITKIQQQHRGTADLSVPDPSVPAKMVLDLPIDTGTTTMTVFMTDYDNYVGIFTCEKLPLIHKWYANILSRTPNLDVNYVNKIRTRLSSYNIDPFSLKTVDQSNCAPPDQ